MKYTTASVVAFAGYAAAAVQGYAPAASCPAAGTAGPDGRYGCNPAHSYPEGQFCTLDNGCYYLRVVAPGLSTSAVASAPCTTTTPAPAPSATTPACPAPGTSGPDGRYACNPAHSYPEGQFCTLDNGCYYLRVVAPGFSTSVVASAPCTTTTSPTPSAPPAPANSTCPAPGSTDSQGRYSCNRAHQYPAGQVCIIIDGCPYLSTETPGATTSAPVSAATPAPPPAYHSGGGNSTTPKVTPYTGGAAKMVAVGAPLAAVAVGVLFL